MNSAQLKNKVDDLRPNYSDKYRSMIDTISNKQERLGKGNIAQFGAYYQTFMYACIIGLRLGEPKYFEPQEKTWEFAPMFKWKPTPIRDYIIMMILNRSENFDILKEMSTNIDSSCNDISNNLTEVNLSKTLQIGDRIRIEGEEDYFFTIDSMFDLNNNEISQSIKPCLLNIYRTFEKGAKIYKMIDSSIDLTITNEFKRPINISAYGSVGEPLLLKCEIDGKTFTGSSEELFQQASKRPIDIETLTKQLSKLSDTSFYLDKIINNLNGNLFMTIGSINLARRNLVLAIESYYQYERNNFVVDEEIDPVQYEDSNCELSAYCTTNEQYEACVKAGIKHIYYENNYCAYVKADYKDISGEVLVGGYGGIYYYKNKNKIVSDYSFNVCNSEAIYYLHKEGVDIVHLSLEMSERELENIVSSYKSKYHTDPNCEITVYGHQNLMTMKYCPLRRYGECGDCQNHTYYLEDSYSKFPTSRKDCITHIYNDKALNLVDDLANLIPLAKRLRLQFTIENKEECEKILAIFKEKMNNPHSVKSYFNKKTDTRGYYKREIL